MVKHTADSLQHLDIDILFLENAVNVRTRAADLTREPGYGTLLTPDFIPDGMSYMDFHFTGKTSRGVPSGGIVTKKSVERLSLLLLRHRQTPSQINSPLPRLTVYRPPLAGEWTDDKHERLADIIPENEFWRFQVTG